MEDQKPQELVDAIVEDKDRSEEAQKILQEEFMKKRQACWEEVAKVLEKYNMQFAISTIISSNGRVMHQIDFERRQ
jgi:hypothetical protein